MKWNGGGRICTNLCTYKCFIREHLKTSIFNKIKCDHLLYRNPFGFNLILPWWNMVSF